MKDKLFHDKDSILSIHYGFTPALLEDDWDWASDLTVQTIEEAKPAQEIATVPLDLIHE